MCYRWGEGGEKAWKKEKERKTRSPWGGHENPKAEGWVDQLDLKKKMQKEVVQCWKALWYSLCFDRFLRWRERWRVVVRNRREVRALFGKVEGKKKTWEPPQPCYIAIILEEICNSLGKNCWNLLEKRGRGECEGNGLFCLWEDGRRGGGGSEKCLWSGWRKPANPKALRFSGQKRRKVELRKWCTRGKLGFSGISFVIQTYIIVCSTEHFKPRLYNHLFNP